MTIELANLSEHDQDRITKLIAGGELLPVMNNTKWAELIGEMRSAPDVKPQFRLRSVFSTTDHVTNWDGEWQYHIQPVQEIEWVELRANSQDWLISILSKYSIPFSIENGFIRVWGYTRPGTQPNWRGA